MPEAAPPRPDSRDSTLLVRLRQQFPHREAADLDAVERHRDRLVHCILAALAIVRAFRSAIWVDVDLDLARLQVHDPVDSDARSGVHPLLSAPILPQRRISNLYDHRD